jgi:putative ABC transport system permease protein
MYGAQSPAAAWRTTVRRSGRVPVARRQLAAEPAKLAVTLLAVAAAMALVLLLAGLRHGISDQTTLYIDRQAPVVVGQRGVRDFIGQPSVLSDRLAPRIAAVPGVAGVTPITEEYAMFRLHSQRVLSLLIGYDPGRAGGPRQLASGRAPRAAGEVVLDRVLASSHGLIVGSTLSFRGATLKVVGLSKGTAGWMVPLAFATRQLSGRPGTASFFFVAPRASITPGAVVARINRAISAVSAVQRSRLANNDRQLFVGAVSGSLFAMVLIAVIVAIIVIGLSVYTSTIERAREYATLKAIGLRPGRLVRLASAQAVGIALGGVVLGTLLAFAGRWAVAELAPKFLIVITPLSVGLMALGALAMALLAAAVPARFMAHLDPASAFRR